MRDESICHITMMYIKSGMYDVLSRGLERSLKDLGIDMEIKCREVVIDGNDKFEITMKHKKEN